jgi:phosphonopyruvate decarboxylase
MASRELYEIRAFQGSGHHRDFLTVGGMGHALQIAVGIARFQPERTVVCLDGDGALLMHTGGMSLSACAKNLFHIVLNNRAHDSVGGQPTPLEKVELTRLAGAFGYEHVRYAANADEVQSHVAALLAQKGSRFLEILCHKGMRDNLGRPKDRPSDNKQKFMDFLSASPRVH